MAASFTFKLMNYLDMKTERTPVIDITFYLLEYIVFNITAAWMLSFVQPCTSFLHRANKGGEIWLVMHFVFWLCEKTRKREEGKKVEDRKQMEEGKGLQEEKKMAHGYSDRRTEDGKC